MDLLTPPPPPTTTTATATATAATVKTPDLETETPQSNTITKHLPPPLTNGVLKRHKPIYQPLAPLTAPAVAYKECLKNHAASIGGHAVDGCGEFMPSPTASPTYPTSLKCAACGCHRNFHRRQPEEPPSYLNHHHPPIQHVIEYQPIHRHHPPPPPQTLPPPPSAGTGAAVDGGSGSPGNSPSPPPISSSYYPSAPHMLLALSTGLSPETHHHPPVSAVGAAVHGGAGAGKKRFRTKFTQNQKEKMHEIAEKVGWKMQKRDEEMIVGFCNEIGVEKGVFKVWMHNNKTTFGSSSSSNNKKEFGEFNGNGSNGGGGGGGDGIDFIISRNNGNGNGNGSNDGGRREVVGDFNDRREVTGNLNDLHLHDSYSKGGIVICTKGSSSSS